MNRRIVRDKDQVTSSMIVSSRPDKGTTPGKSPIWLPRQDMHNDCSVGASEMPLHSLGSPIPVPPSLNPAHSEGLQTKERSPKAQFHIPGSCCSFLTLKLPPKSPPMCSACDHTWAQPQLVENTSTSSPLVYNLQSLPVLVGGGGLFSGAALLK